MTEDKVGGFTIRNIEEKELFEQNIKPHPYQIVEGCICGYCTINRQRLQREPAVGFASEAEIYQLAIDTYGPEKQIDMAIEEMSELTKELLKTRRQPNRLGSISDVWEEIADVSIMLEQLKILYAMDEEAFQDRKALKLKKLLGYLNFGRSKEDK